mgnify:CR=1 FL=1
MSFGKVVSDPVLYALCVAPFLAWAGIAWHYWKKKTNLVDHQAAKLASHETHMIQLNARIAELEVELGLKDDEVKEAWSRWENATSLVRSYGEGRMRIIQNLDRFGMTLDAKDEIVVRGPRMYPSVWKNGEIVKPASMVPILAKGLEQTPPPRIEGDPIPIICWYRLVPDEKIKGQINEEFSHYEDAEMVLQDPKNRKNKTMTIKLPTESVPSPRGGTKFSGKWRWHLKQRTGDQSPRITEHPVFKQSAKNLSKQSHGGGGESLI